MNLRSAVALITGGSAGIGRAIAQSLAASGLAWRSPDATKGAWPHGRLRVPHSCGRCEGG